MLHTPTKYDPFAGPELECVVYTTKAQSEIWTACYLGENDAARAYNESISIEFIGPLDPIAMDKAFQNLVDRHESLRSSFSTDGLYMSIYKNLIIKITTIDLSNLESINKKQALDQYIRDDADFLFDLVNGPLLKVGLLKLYQNKHQLVITVHHIICDGWSIGIMLQDLGILYSAIADNKTPYLTAAIPFSAYAHEEQIFSESDENRETEQFWHNVYKKSIPLVTVPTDFVRPPVRTYKSQRLDFTFDANLLSSLKQTGLTVGASLVSTLLTTFEVFLSQLSGQDDLVVGLPSAGQASKGMTHLMGHCVNLLPLRSNLNANSPFIEYLKKRKSELFDAYDHSQLSFGHLLQSLKVARDPSRIPLVPIVFNIDLGMTDGVHFFNLNYTLISNPKAYDPFEIFVNASGTEKDLVFEWSYNEALFKSETIKEMMQSFIKIIQNVVKDPSITLGQLTFEDFTADYDELNRTKTDYPHVSLHELFALQSIQTPTNIALEFLDTAISYQELQDQTNQMAHYLTECGVAYGDFVAISLPRSAELVISLLAIMQCGAAYLPLDPEYPISRLQFMMEDSEAKFLLTNQHLSNSLPSLSTTILIENAIEALHKYPHTRLKTKVNPADPVYLLYTSGSTGNPKGVSISHKNLVNLLCSLTLEPGIIESDRVLSITTISFDIASVELFLPLLNGATLILADSETARDGRLLIDLIQSSNISFLQATPVTWSMLLDSGWSQKLPIKALCGGEALPADLAQKLLTKCTTLWNVYGPTETTVYSLAKQIKDDTTLITIGKPIANTQIYIINDQQQLVAPGIIGEIAIAGDGVANGYWNRPELTDEKFIKNPFSTEDAVFYRTGDLGRLLPIHEIECLGRVDQQVKIRGHRIEPGEVEQALLAIEGIKKAVVLANEDFLIAHVVPYDSIENAKQFVASWRENLLSQLPPHLVPHAFNLIEKIPTTLNGKIDRKALSQYTALEDRKYTAPRTEDEKLVADIWKESLNLDTIDIFSNFFEMGGHSIKAVKVMIEIEKITGKRIPLSVLFKYSTVEKFAKLLHTKSDICSDCLVPIKASGDKTPLFIIHGAGLNVLNFVNLSKHFNENQPIYGIQGNAKKYDAWYESIEEMAAHYIDAIVKINPNGPYALAGFSFGGIVAFEMTRQLKEQGKNVTLTALLDSYVDSSYYYQTFSKKKLIRYFDLTHKRLNFLREMLMSWKAFKMRTNAKKDYILKRHFGHNPAMTEQEAVALEQFIEADSMVKTIVDRYHLKPQNIEVDLFRSQDDLHYKLDPTHLGWKKAALKGVKIHNISGNHLDIVAPPNDKLLARLLQDILDEKHAKI
ncbi:non-ribosomal peptide synthetase [Flavobacterium sp. TMP13]|uniref:non-ribosomal peptide synthetase n=1 Tax=Flavobacterium sp. TMP13 TaxID=3425950 RepID=UPI003D781A6A